MYSTQLYAVEAHCNVRSCNRPAGSLSFHAGELARSFSRLPAYEQLEDAAS